MEIKPHYREGRWWGDRKMRNRFFSTDKERLAFAQIAKGFQWKNQRQEGHLQVYC